MILSAKKGKPEIFYSVQGEATNLGVPCIFIRLFGCNLRCHFCDTSYTWNKESIKMESKEVAKFIVKMKTPCNRIVITGGEPLLQQTEIVNLMKELDSLGTCFNLEIETNGTVVPIKELMDYVDVMNVSIKTSNSGNNLKQSIKRLAIDSFVSHATCGENVYFKFVVKEAGDIAEIKKIIKKFKLIDIIIMPEGITPTKILKGSKELVEVCKKEGWRFTPRLHTLLWGNTRAK